MTTTAKRFASLAAALLALATAIGALSAHAFRVRVGAAQYDILRTAVHYQFFHSLGLLGVALLLDRIPAAALRVAAWLLAFGIVLFSGSLYLLAAGVPRSIGTAIGILTPVGGLALILSWCLVAVVLAFGTARRSS